MRATISLLLLLGAQAQALPEDAAYRAATAGRRERLLARLPEHAVVVVRAAADPKSEVSERFRQGSDFWYLTAFPEADAVAVLRRAEGRVKYVLFVPPKDFAREQWTGYRAGPEGARQVYGADEAYVLDELPKQLPELLKGASGLYFSDAGEPAFFDKLREAWAKGERDALLPRPMADLGPLVHAQRLVKDDVEVQLMRKAGGLSAEAHKAALARVRPGAGEAHLKAAMVESCLAGGAARMGYAPIVGSGRHAVILHYDQADQELRAGDMIVNDSACEYGLYTSDVTRSYPVSGRFSPEQRAIYELVLRAQEAGLARVRPGAVYHEIYDATVEVIVDGLLQLGLLSGERGELLRTRAYKTFYPHGCCHWIGLNVHDPGSYEPSEAGEDRLARYASAQAVLQPGMLTTVEPGIYIPEGSTPDKRWWNVGVRIEDTVLVTPSGHECLSCAAPRALLDVERALAAKRR